MSDWQWHDRALCPCGWSRRAPHGDLFHVHATCCPECGRRKETWSVRTMRWEADQVPWWKPWTWGRGRFVNLQPSGGTER